MKKIAITLCTIVVLLTLVEVFLRLFPQTLHGLYICKDSTDPEIAYELIPLAKDISRNIFINSDGYRDYLYPKQKQQNVFRIACIGDSHTFGYGVSLEESYPKQLERLLKKLSSNCKRYEVINFGVPGYNFFQYVAYLEKKIIQYTPDVVIFGFVINGDIYDITVPLVRFISPCIKNFFRENFYIYRFLMERKEVIRQKILAKKEMHATPTKEESDYVTILYSNKEFPKRWQKLCTGLSRIKRLSIKYNFKTIFIIFPFIVNKKPYPYTWIHKILEQEFKKYKFDVIDLENIFSKYTAKQLLLMHDWHPNTFAYGLISKEILKKIAKK